MRDCQNARVSKCNGVKREGVKREGVKMRGCQMRECKIQKLCIKIDRHLGSH